MKALKTKAFDKPIIYCKYLDDDTLLVVDNDTTIKYLNSNTFEVLNGFKFNVNHTWYKNSIVSFSDDGSIFALKSADSKYSKVYDIKLKKTIAKVDRHNGEVSCVAVDPKGKYFFSCGEDGKTFVTDVKSAKLSFTLPPHIDEINDIVFSDNTQYVATASYDKKILIFNLLIMAPHAKLISHSAPVIKIKFLSKHRFFSIDRLNNAIIWDLHTNKIIVRLSGIHDDVLHVAVSENYLFLSTILGYIIVYDLENYQQISRKFLNMGSTITSLEFNEKSDELLVGTKSGTLSLYNIYEGKDKLENLFNENKYAEMERYIKFNPFLEYSKPYILMLDTWEKTLKKATELFQNAKNEEAQESFKYFKDIPAKQTIIKKLVRDYADFSKFLLMIKKGKISLAYSIANNHPVYKKSRVYEILERRWRKLFHKAQKLLKESNGKEKVKELLVDYRGISDKTKHIQEMFAKNEIYNRFKNEIAQKNYKVVFQLVKVNNFLREFPEYFSVLTFGDNLYIKINKYIQSGDIHKASKLLLILQDFPEFEIDVKKILKEIENQGKFLKSIDDEDLETAYNLLDNSNIISQTVDGMYLNKLWKDDLEMAKVYASTGNVLDIDGILDKYKGITSKNMALASIYSWAYNIQIEDAIEHNKKKEVVEKAIKNYVIYFGLEDHINSTYEMYKNKFKNSKLNIDLLKKGSKELWRPSMRVINILE